MIPLGPGRSCRRGADPPVITGTRGGSDPCVSHPSQEQGVSFWCPAAGNSPEGHSLQHGEHGKSAGFMPMGNAGRILLKLFLLYFQSAWAFVCVATSVEHPGGTSSVSVFYQCSGLSTCDCITHLWGPKEIWGYSEEIWQGPVLNEDSRPLFSRLVLAKWKKQIRKTSFIVVC